MAMRRTSAKKIPLVRLTQNAEGNDRYRVEIALENGKFRRTATVRFPFTLPDQDQEDVRWYLEEYIQKPFEPAPTIARRVEQRIEEIGTELFRALFQANDDGRDIWAMLRDTLRDTRVEIVTEVREATAIPWELLRDPKTATPLALEARAFVRTHHSATRQPRQPASSTPIRILLVISRPRRNLDVPFRSVASRLIKNLSERDDFQLDVLRPPTFEQLGRVLRKAKAAGKPYHVVHFDGHGTYSDPTGDVRLSRDKFTDNRPGQHGYLLFEEPKLKHNYELVSGPDLGKLLAETDVPVLVLNACRSAHAEPADKPAQVGETTGQVADPDPHTEVRAFGSLAQEVIDAGVAGVVAMRYNVFVVTAAQFVAELYGALTQGSTLGEAVSRGRKHLYEAPLREVVAGPLPLQDWSVPVVYEAAPIALFSRLNDDEVRITLNQFAATPTRGTLDPALPRPPDVGFFGRDETLLALDRAFDTQRVVLLHAFAGSGKTTTVAEFARWYALTGGVEGPVIFTTFEQPQPLPRVLDTLGRTFGPLLEQNGIQWLALDDEQRRNVALQILSQIPVLWIWDNVEPVAGFPAGTPSRLSADEQRVLADFLRDVRDTQAKLLLTSRRDERGWLGDLPVRIPMPSMPMPERIQLARAIAEKHNRQLRDVAPWEPLLKYTQGNPLTLTVLVGQALRDGLRTKKQIEDFVVKLRAGEAAFDDDANQGRSKSLGASLSYGFEHAFTEHERKQLALLHFFQGFVDVDALRWMGDPDDERGLPEVRGLTREAGIALLDRATEVGLLTSYGGGYYAIHPALPWYFKSLFDQYYPTNEQRLQAARAFVEAIGELGDYYTRQYNQGKRDVINVLSAEEANLLHARQLAQMNGWWSRVISTMQGLRSLYGHTGRRVEWQRLVEEIIPEFVDPVSDEPLPGREEQWSFITEYRVRLALEARQLSQAERLQRIRVESERQRAQPALALSTDVLDSTQRNVIRSLATSLHDLGQIQRELGQAECVTAYQESLTLSEHIGEKAGAAICALNLGNSYKDIPAVRDLDQAEHWYLRSLELRDERDHLGRGRCLVQLGTVAYERFNEARAANLSKAELLQHLNAALQSYIQALDLLPPDAVNDLAVTHGQLGHIFVAADDLNRALTHWHETMRYMEAANNHYGAGLTRFNIAGALARRSRFGDALLYAQTALRNYETYGAGATEMIERTQQLIADIEAAIEAAMQKASERPQ